MMSEIDPVQNSSVDAFLVKSAGCTANYRRLHGHDHASRRNGQVDSCLRHDALGPESDNHHLQHLLSAGGPTSRRPTT